MGTKKLSDREFWENYWETRNVQEPEIKRSKKGLSINSILDVFDKYLPVNDTFHALEIGGAPGRYLIYMAKNFKYHVHSLDYSNIGNEQTKKNLASANIPIEVYQRDLFSKNSNNDLPLFDMVYSLGFIEHFEDLDLVVKKHFELLKPGGILLLGVPNLGGIYRFFLKRTAPQHLAMHNLEAMKIKNWNKFERQLNLNPIFKGYITGFEPLVMIRREKKSVLSYSLNVIVFGLMLIFSYRFSFLRRFNSRYWSGYLMGIYKKNRIH
jgi:SAM-dependent methyltransferase